MGRATISSHYGAPLGNSKVTELDFADDVANLLESLETLVATFDAFSNEDEALGSKTKIQDFGSLLGPLQFVHACGEYIEVSETLTYLFNVVHVSELSDQEVN